MSIGSTVVISRVPHTPESILIIRDPFRGKMRSCSRPSREANRCVLLDRPQILGSGRLQPLRAAHLPPLQNNMSPASGALLGLSQWEGEKEGRSVGGARCMNAAAQTAGQFADDRQPSTAPDGFRCRAIVRDSALYDVACKHQLHSQFWMSSVELCMSCHIGQ
jgi:hypothetical protein